MILLPTSYFPPITWMAIAVQKKEIWIEACEHFPKQTWRNRCSILGTDRIQQLVVPLSQRKDKTLTRDIRIDYAQPWQKIHFRTLQACYRRSPWFEFYEDDLSAFFERKDEFLLDLNSALTGMLLDWLRKDVGISLTTSYEENPTGIDLRDHLNKKSVFANYEIPKYKEGNQVLSGKNLSVLDLLFNQGKNSGDILESIRVLPQASE